MKKTVLYFLAFMLFVSCKNLPSKNMIMAAPQMQLAAKPNSSTSSNRENFEPGKKEKNDFLLAKNSTIGWTPAEKTTFMTACVEGTTEAMGENKSANYCACLLTKLEQLYPVADEVINLPEKKQNELSQQCLQ